MEGKTVIFSVLVIGLVVIAQIQVEAEFLVCCPSESSRENFDLCISYGASQPACSSITGCVRFLGSTCPPFLPDEIVKNSGKLNSFSYVV
ncbi:unnamed protein product [Arabidopsis lyrata]|uniref:Acidic protein n=1 Tax=Arabidopsis lyrata subsp. lyrata TaxID=81972 RepID=D7L3I4_ARALL|nr:hypothetical protein ARALYDRAFT_899723 [Arabidopsis lyrata subsp. lyrata]CAH8262279.1 unnamed protein product [Arabidopsis lyrata]